MSVNMSNSEFENFKYAVRCRGLPWSAQKEDVMRFFHDCSVEQIIFGKDHTGRASGEAFISFTSEADLKKAVNHHNENMTKRYIEVYKSSAEELEWFRSRSARAQQPRDGVVHVRGLPYGCVESDLEDFFKEFSLGQNGMVLLTDAMGRTTGDAYIQFSSAMEAGSAIQKKHMKKMGHRYLELFPSSIEHAQRALGMQDEKNMYGVGDSFSGRRGRGGPLRSHQAGGRSAPYARPVMNAGDGMGGGGGGGFDFQGSRFPQSQMNNFGGFNNMTPMGFGRGNSVGFGRGGFGDFGNNQGGGIGFGSFNRNSSQGFGRQSQQGFGGDGGGGGGSGDAFQPAVVAAAAGMMNRQGFGNPGQGSSVIRMRGLPYQATVQDIYEFFDQPAPVQVEIGFKDNGQSSGEADAVFANHEQAMNAMSKNGQNIGSRYIELFLK